MSTFVCRAHISVGIYECAHTHDAVAADCECAVDFVRSYTSLFMHIPGGGLTLCLSFFFMLRLCRDDLHTHMQTVWIECMQCILFGLTFGACA